MTYYPLATSTWDEKEKSAIDRVIKSDRYSMGVEVARFEQEFATFFGSKYSVMVNSGSSANLLAVAALFFRNQGPKLERGDEVIVPAVSWSTTYSPLQQYGLKLKFVDIDPETLNIDLNQVEQAISEKTKLIFAVNLLGNSNDFIRLNSLCKEKDIILIEDNCESMGAELNGKYAGTFGTIGTFSTFFSHHMATMEGGVLTTDDREVYEILLSLRSHGWTRHLPEENLLTGKKSSFAFEESFKFILPGYNLRPVEMSGAIGREQLKKLPSFIENRRKNAQLFQEMFNNHDFFRIQKETGSSSWFGFSLVLKENNPERRNQLVNFLTEKKIETRPVISGNFLNNDVIKFYDYSLHGEMKEAEYLDKNSFFIGNHHFSLEKELNYLNDTIDEFFKEN